MPPPCSCVPYTTSSPAFQSRPCVKVFMPSVVLRVMAISSGLAPTKLRDAHAHLVDLLAAIVVRRVFGDLAEDALVGLGDHARHRAFGAVVHEGHAVDDVELAADLPPVRLVERAGRLQRVEARAPASRARPARRARTPAGREARHRTDRGPAVPPMKPRRDNPLSRFAIHPPVRATDQKSKSRVYLTMNERPRVSIGLKSVVSRRSL